MRFGTAMLLILMMFCAATASAQIGVIRVLRLDQTTPLLYESIMVPPPLRDLDRDGIPEVVIRENGLFCELSGTPDVWDFDVSAAGLINPQFLGFFRMDGVTGPATHALFIDEVGVSSAKAMLNNKYSENMKHEVVTTATVKFFTMRRLASGHEVAVFGDGENIFIIGETTRFQSGEARLSKTGAPAAYELVEKYAGAKGDRLGYNPAMFPFEGQIDANADGVDDLAFIRNDQNGNPVGVVLYGGRSFDEIWSWTFPEADIERITTGFHGFADVDGDGVKELFCGDNLVVFRDGTLQELRDQFRIQHFVDVDNDGFLDVIGRDLAADRVLILGKSTASAVKAPPAPSLATLHPSYPNPATGTTTVSFSLQVASPARVKVYDAQGRLVRTLVHEIFQAGLHQLVWDGTDDAGALLPAGGYSAVLYSTAGMQRQSILITR